MAEIVIRMADDNSGVKIVSCGYSLIWVRKHTENGKLKYTVIPVEEHKKAIPELTPEEWQKMSAFATNANQLIESF